MDDYKIISKGIKSVKERVTNISDHLNRPVNTDTFRKLMVDSIMQGSDKEYKLTPADQVRINAIAKEKFESWEWNYGTSPKFNITRTGRFDGGKMEFKLDVNKGKITDCHIYGDFFGTMDISVLSDALIDTNYEKESIKKAIEQCDIKHGFYNINMDELADIIC
nr:lipoate protein ligase C-terminal domain-containing protein [uncultured Acetobacterium sp.]